ncbi:MAG: hypothetical protein ABSA57_00545 [Candidatus Acidiferrales bacterium]
MKDFGAEPSSSCAADVGAGACVAGGLLRPVRSRLIARGALSDLRFQLIQLRVSHPDFVKVTALERAEFCAEVLGAQLALGQLRLQRRLFFALPGEFLLLGLGGAYVLFSRCHGDLFAFLLPKSDI